MIVVRVELHSAITGEVSELARAVICNEGINDTGSKGDYGVYICRGRDKEALNKSWLNRTFTKTAKVIGHARQAEHVLNLVSKALIAAGYKSK